MASTTSSRSTGETPRTTDPAVPTSGVHPSPEEAAEIIQREVEEYRAAQADAREEGPVRGVTPSAAELTTPVEGLLTSGNDDAKDADEFVRKHDETVEKAIKVREGEREKAINHGREVSEQAKADAKRRQSERESERDEGDETPTERASQSRARGQSASGETKP
jgi:hypothetical protein